MDRKYGPEAYNVAVAVLTPGDQRLKHDDDDGRADDE